ncbi:MAG: hypothetical protein ACJ72H_11490 [Candidatus Sulfotelmatobacter sp.]
MNFTRLVLAGALMLTLPALAHEVAKGPNGGRVAEAGDYHVEAVAKGPVMDVFLTDAADKPIAATGFKGLAILAVTGKSVRITLQSADATRLSGTAAIDLPHECKGVVQITAPGGRTAQAKFN